MGRDTEAVAQKAWHRGRDKESGTETLAQRA